jgi:murein L,D-transpeptidase YafK
MLRRASICLVLWPCLVGARPEVLPAYVLLLPPSVHTVLIAETDTASLHRYHADENGLVAANEQRVSIGQNGVRKQTAGDRKTPLGIYFVLEELDTSNLHEKYGPVAFPLDYPNVWDQLHDRTGSGIWIHGVTPNSGPRPERDTDGCIALENASLLALQGYLTATQTPVIVTRRLQQVSPEEIARLRESLLAAVHSWAADYRLGDWHHYLALYADDFTYRGLSRAEWSIFRLQSAGNRPISNFSIDDIMLLADPEEPGLFLSRFRQTTTESGRLITITKRLYWRANERGELKIVAEDNG